LKQAEVRRCDWAAFRNNPLMIDYHDKEWGVPVHDDNTLFEFLVLEGAQAGLSWETIRNRLKIEATITNAKQFLIASKEFGSFDEYIWRFVAGKPIKHRFSSLSQIPATTKESDAMSKELRARGFRFVGPTICYAFMQAVGMVNDHTTNCFRYDKV